MPKAIEPGMEKVRAVRFVGSSLMKFAFSFSKFVDEMLLQIPLQVKH